MNKNKIVFSIIGGIIFLLLVLGISSMKGGKTPTTTNHINVSSFTIWIVHDDINKFQEFLGVFKSTHPKYANTNFTIESFPSYSEYYYSLIGAFLKGTAPDIFVLNNNEKTSVFEEQILGIDPNIFNPNDLAKEFEPVFTKDLVLKTEVDLGGDDGMQTIEFIKGVPLGYETPGLFYDFIKFKGYNLTTWAGLNDAVTKVLKRFPKITPIGLGNGTTVFSSFDFITSLFVQNGVLSLDDKDDKKIEQSLYTYLSFGNLKGDNKYNSLYSDLLKKGYTNLDSFSRGEVGMIFGYPRLLNEIDKKGYKKSLLKAGPFPQSSKSNGSILINYNYFVINKNSNYTQLSKELLEYFSTEEGEKEFLKQFTYYLPAHLSLLSRKMEQKIHPDYGLELGNFYNDTAQLVSFDKKTKVLYDDEIVKVLDDNVNYKDLYNQFRSKLLCKYGKMINQEGLSRSCK